MTSPVSDLTSNPAWIQAVRACADDGLLKAGLERLALDAVRADIERVLSSRCVLTCSTIVELAQRVFAQPDRETRYSWRDAADMVHSVMANHGIPCDYKARQRDLERWAKNQADAAKNALAASREEWMQVIITEKHNVLPLKELRQVQHKSWQGSDALEKVHALRRRMILDTFQEDFLVGEIHTVSEIARLAAEKMRAYDVNLNCAPSSVYIEQNLLELRGRNCQLGCAQLRELLPKASPLPRQ